MEQSHPMQAIKAGCRVRLDLRLHEGH